MLKIVDTKIKFLKQIIFFFDKEFYKTIINPKFYQRLFSALLMKVQIGFNINTHIILIQGLEVYFIKIMKMRSQWKCLDMI